MVAFEVINARECTLTDITAEMLVRRLHGGPGRRGISGVKQKPPGLRPREGTTSESVGGKGEVLVFQWGPYGRGNF